MSDKKGKPKQTLVEIGNVRIREYDQLNVQIERYETYWNPKEGKETSGWRFKGYSATIISALKAVVTKELLIDREAVRDAESLLKEVYRANTKVFEAIEEVKKHERQT